MKHIKKTTKPVAITIAAVIAELEKLATKYGADAKLVTNIRYVDNRCGGYGYGEGYATTVNTRVVRDRADEITGIYVAICG